MNTMPRKVLFRLSLAIAVTLSLASPTSCSYGKAALRSGEETGSEDRAGPSANAPITKGSKQPKWPNVLLIGIDTLRADHLGCLGYARNTTPTLDRLAREGVLCTKSMSASGWTIPSVMSVMTSLYPDVHQVRSYKNKLSDRISTLAGVLQSHGYMTAGFVSNPAIEGRYGFSSGFALYDDFTVGLDFTADIFEQHDKVIEDPHVACTSEPVTQAALRWLRHRPAQPFLMFVFYFDPHYDYLPPKPYDTMFDPDYQGDIDGRGSVNEPRHSHRPADRDLRHLLALYDGEIRYTDSYVAKLLEAFADEGLSENTLVVLFGDHGDEFYEHGRTGHARTLYSEIVHVPLILSWPGRLPAGTHIDVLTGQVDIMPTILDYLDLRHDGDMQGSSLRPVIEGKTDKLHDTLWTELDHLTHVQATINEHYRLVRDVDKDAWELYDLSRDPGEQTNLCGQSPVAEIRLAMQAKWEKWTKDNDVLSNRLLERTKPQENSVSEQQLQQLKALGYVQ
jgi:arylsulfatase A-like enzyme